MTTTEKTFQVPLTFKDNSTDLEKSAPKAYDTLEANQALAMIEILPDIEFESEMPSLQEEAPLAPPEELEMSPPAIEELPPVATGNVSLPAALVDEELLKELTQIPDKMGFKIGDVADLLGIKAYVLRYWETEFDMLKPKKAANNQRYYTKKNVENAFLIRKLLHRDRFSIEGARAAIRDLKSVVKKEKDWTQVTTKMNTLEERLDHLIVDLKQLKNLFH